MAQVACDKHGWVFGFTSHPGSIHDSRTFINIQNLLEAYYPKIEMEVMDAGCKTATIAHRLMQKGITPVFPCKRPMTKQGNFKKYEFIYDSEFDGYTCPEGQWLNYATTNHSGYRECKNLPRVCVTRFLLSQCTQSRNHVKVFTRHIWSDDIEATE